MDTKKCIKCGIEKGEVEFYDAKGKTVKKPKKINTCKKCFNLLTHGHTKTQYADKQKTHLAYLAENPNATKECRICKQVLPLGKFAFHATMADLMSSECRECRGTQAKKRASQKKASMREMDFPKTKVCKICGNEKNITDFNLHYGNKDLHRTECIDCQKLHARAYYPTIRDAARAKGKIWYSDNKELNHGYHLKRKFNLSREMYQKMLDDQDGVCKICGSDKPRGRYDNFSVDHDHKTGEIRGLLCSFCNTGIGQFQDSPSLLRKAATYLESFKQ
jgi:hypothetical protein